MGGDRGEAVLPPALGRQRLPRPAEIELEPEDRGAEDAATLQSPDVAAAAILRFITEPFTTGFRLRVAGSARDQVEAV